MIKDAYRFALPPLLAGLLCFIPGWRIFGAVLIFLGLFVFYFFRDPQRVIPTTPEIIISPADGKVVEIVDEMLDSVMGHRISIFFSIWNVHVQRAPPPPRWPHRGRGVSPRPFLRRVSLRRLARKRTKHYLSAHAAR